MSRKRGFTLLELMIVIVIVAVLATLAFGSYNKQVRKSRRAEAKQVLSDLSLREEKYRSNNPNYGTCNEVTSPSTCAALNLGLTYYSVAVSFPTSGTCAGGAAAGNANSYILTATALGDQANDTGCTSMVLTNNCGIATTKSPTSCW